MKTTMTRLAAAVAAVGTLLAALLLLAGPANAATTPPPPPTSSGTGGVHVSNPHPHAGATIVVSGASCTPGARVTVSLDGTPVAHGRVNRAGRYHIPVHLPKNLSAGQHTISISVAGGSCRGSGVLGIDVTASNTTSGGSSGSLASTGVAVVGIGALGVVLLAGGAMMLLAGRRRTHA